MFCEGNLASVKGVMEVLKDFKLRSGISLSIQKTCFFAAGLSNSDISSVADDTGLSTCSLPIRYLGVPLCTKKLFLINCDTLIQSIKNRVNTWASKSLSFVGRLQLLTTVIAYISNFWANSFILLSACTDEKFNL